MGAIPHAGGTTFRVWAPHATAVAVVGTFNDWDATRHLLARDDGGAAETWSGEVPEAAAGDEYRFVLSTQAGELNRIDPRARRLTNSVGNAVVYDPDAFDWGDAEFHQPAWNDLVIYELHVGTFSSGMHGRPGTLDGVRKRLPYLRNLGVGAVQLMPPFEFAGDRSWGYNPAYPFAVESTYGSPDVDPEAYAMLDRVERERAARFFGDARTVLTGSGLPEAAFSSEVLVGTPRDVIADEARRWGADLLVAGSHGFGVVKRLLLGSVSNALVHEAPCSVLVVRERERR